MSTRDEAYSKPGVPDELKWQPVMRGFPSDVEVLTDAGWVLFEDLYRAGLFGVKGGSGPLFEAELDWSQDHKPLRENWAGNKTKHQLPYDFAHHKEIDFSKFRVGSSFPRVATLSPDHLVRSRGLSGNLVFVTPMFATRFTYENLQLVWLKKRGVDLAVPRYTDLFVKNKFQSRWVFGVADDFCVTRKVSGAYKMVVNRYEPRGVLSGSPSGRKLVELSSAGELKALMGDEFPARFKFGTSDSKRARVWDVYPFPPVRDAASGRYVVNPVKNTGVECYNLVLPPGSSHTLIVRRKGKFVDGENPRTEWVGFPVVVGDGYDKNLIEVDRLNGLYR